MAGAARGQGPAMAENDTYKIVELAGTSPDGVTEAMRSGVERANATLRGVDWIEVTGIRGHVEDGEIAHFQVTMKIGLQAGELRPRAHAHARGSAANLASCMPPRAGSPGHAR